MQDISNDTLLKKQLEAIEVIENQIDYTYNSTTEVDNELIKGISLEFFINDILDDSNPFLSLNNERLDDIFLILSEVEQRCFQRGYIFQINVNKEDRFQSIIKVFDVYDIKNENIKDNGIYVVFDYESNIIGIYDNRCICEFLQVLLASEYSTVREHYEKKYEKKDFYHRFECPLVEIKKINPSNILKYIIKEYDYDFYSNLYLSLDTKNTKESWSEFIYQWIHINYHNNISKEELETIISNIKENNLLRSFMILGISELKII